MCLHVPMKTAKRTITQLNELQENAGEELKNFKEL